MEFKSSIDRQMDDDDTSSYEEDEMTERNLHSTTKELQEKYSREEEQLPRILILTPNKD